MLERPAPTGHDVLLAVSRGANSALELDDVLARTAAALTPYVPLGAISLVGYREGVSAPRAVHLVGANRRKRETLPEFLKRVLGVGVAPAELELPLEKAYIPRLLETPGVLASEDISARPDCHVDRLLAKFGARSEARAALVARGAQIGAIHFIRLEVRPFTDEEVSILNDVVPLLANALANALAYEEIRQLKEQLEQENLLLREQVDDSGMYMDIVGSSRALRGVIAQVERVGPTDSTVLITGETGVGKELVARAVHRRSQRAERPMIKVSCASLPATLIASELFGHERGAFTGAGERRIGRFELASEGSIFLDEVGELPPEIQVSLLRVLQEKEFERVGGSHTIRTNARVIAATNRDLNAAVASGRFRSDLYYRLNIFPIEVPPLRSRREDIPKLVEHFAAVHGTRLGKKFLGIPKRTMERLVAYDWPGNVRECANLIERAVILSDGPQLEIDERLLPPEHSMAVAVPGGGGSSASIVAVTRQSERELIERALAACGGRISGPNGAARQLGIPASTLESKLRRLGIDKFRHRSAGRM